MMEQDSTDTTHATDAAGSQELPDQSGGESAVSDGDVSVGIAADDTGQEAVADEPDEPDEPDEDTDPEEPQEPEVAHHEPVEAAPVAAIHPAVAPVDKTSELLVALAHLHENWQADHSAAQQESEKLADDLTDLSGKVALLSTTMAAMTVTLQKVAEETGQLTDWSRTVKGVGTLSKLFQVASVLVLVLLLGGISYLALQHDQAQQHLHRAQAVVADTVKLQQKQLAEYDKHFAGLVGTEISKEREAAGKSLVQEKLNRLRNGAAEQQLYRKTNGDWLAVNGKIETPLSDPELLELLNQTFVKSGRVLKTPYPVPPHKVLTLLKPNGQGGTEIVVTKEVAP